MFPRLQDLHSTSNHIPASRQHSLNLAWELLLKPEYDKLRACLCQDEDEIARFRSLVVNGQCHLTTSLLRYQVRNTAMHFSHFCMIPFARAAVMATDVMDKELGAARTYRWHKAFSDGDDWAGQQESQHVKSNRKATIVIEHLIQVSVSYGAW
jgi:hypothetical protein